MIVQRQMQVRASGIARTANVPHKLPLPDGGITSKNNPMQDISYTSKLIHAEDGRPLALDYYIVANDGEPGNYGVKIIEKNSGEQAMAFDLTTKAQRICELVEKLSQNCVTPASLMDVLADWL